MNIVLLSTLLLVEIIFVIYTLCKKSESSIWLRNRVICNGAELLVAIVFLVFPDIDFSAKFKGLYIILFSKLIVSVIIYFIKRNKATGNIKISRVVRSTIRTSLMIILGLSLSFIIKDYKCTPPSGSYEVKQTSAILIDNNRLESFEDDGSYREIPIHFFYPETTSNEKFPLVIFSHGAFGYYQSNMSTYNELASNGYVVIALDHPYHSFFTTDTNGKTITVNPEFINSVMAVNSGKYTESEIFEMSKSWMNIRVNDISYVIDSIKNASSDGINQNWFLFDQEENINCVLNIINTDKIGVMGHSLGGAASVEIGRLRNDVSAVIDLDGTMLGEYVSVTECEPYEFEGRTYTEINNFNQAPYTTPILSIDNDEHHYSRLEADRIGMLYANNEVMKNAVEGFDTYVKNSGHMNFTDLPLIAPVLAKMFKIGSVDVQECLDITNNLVLNFMNCYLKDQGIFTIEDSYGD